MSSSVGQSAPTALRDASDALGSVVPRETGHPSTLGAVAMSRKRPRIDGFIRLLAGGRSSAHEAVICGDCGIDLVASEYATLNEVKLPLVSRCPRGLVNVSITCACDASQWLMLIVVPS